MKTTIGLITGEEVVSTKWVTKEGAIDDWSEGIMRNTLGMLTDRGPLFLEIVEPSFKRVTINPAHIVWMRFE